MPCFVEQREYKICMTTLQFYICGALNNFILYFLLFLVQQKHAYHGREALCLFRVALSCTLFETKLEHALNGKNLYASRD
jgi:hypothetical protein